MATGEANSSFSALDETVHILAAGQKVFSRYTLKHILGRGGMGVVWLAMDEELNRQVAIKFLPEIVWRDRDAVGDLKRETKRSLELTHSHIVRIYDFLADAQRAGISMEFVEGGTLSEKKGLRSQRCFDAGDIGVWIKQICEALDYAHQSAKIVHRDLKPSNIMLTSRGDIKVADFGIARNISETMSRFSAGDTGIIGGTLAYMSPQQLNGEKPDILDDIYSLGATIYELLTGKPPFYSGDLHRQIENKQPPTMAQRRAELGVSGQPIPAHWEETIAVCLSKDASKRPASAMEVARRLQLAVNDGLAFSGWTAPRNRKVKPIAIVGGLALTGLMVHLGWPEADDGGKKPHENPAFKQVSRPVLPSMLAGLPQGRHWENSLGMRFVPVGNIGVSIWETRVRDFQEFAAATGHDAMAGFISFGRDGWRTGVHNWKDPGFPQGADHPVCGVNWEDAQAFCRWLTEKERAEGRIKPTQSYRLPTDEEWTMLAGSDQYPWGNDPQAPEGSGNFAGTEVLRDGDWPSDRPVLEGYDDGYPRTSPVGSFRPNQWGIYDLSGNLWEWCEDSGEADQKERLLRGSSWHNYNLVNMQVGYRSKNAPATRNASTGFRCVLEEKTGG